MSFLAGFLGGCVSLVVMLVLFGVPLGLIGLILLALAGGIE